MENVLLDQSSASFELQTRAAAGRFRRGAGARWATPHGGYGGSFLARPPQPYHQQHNGGAWSSAPALPYARPPVIHSSPSLPLLPSNQPPLLPLPPTVTKYATLPSLPAATPPPRAGRGAAAATTAAAPAAPALPAPCQQRDSRRRRRPARPPPPSTEPPRAQMKKKPLERATPLPPAPVVDEALDDLEQEVARNFVQDLLHVLAPPPSSLPLPRFSLVMKASSTPTAARVLALAAPSCNAEAAAADGIRGLLRL